MLQSKVQKIIHHVVKQRDYLGMSFGLDAYIVYSSFASFN